MHSAVDCTLTATKICVPTAPLKVPHGYERMSLYDGPTSTDDYHQWFARVMPGVSPEQGWPFGSNGWEGGPFMFNESMHPTAWVGQQAVDFINDPIAAGSGGRPWFLKVCASCLCFCLGSLSRRWVNTESYIPHLTV